MANFFSSQPQMLLSLDRLAEVSNTYSMKPVERPFRAANNGRSTDNVRSKLGIDRTNPWIAGHLVRSFTDSFREILIFNYLIITRDNIHVSKRKQKEYKTRQISGREIPGSHKFPRCHQVLSRPKSACLPLFYLLYVFPIGRRLYLWLDTMIDS